MSIEIQRAKEFLKKIEDLKSDSSNVFYLFTGEDTISQRNFLYQVDIDGQYIIDYLTKILKTKPIFSEYEIYSNNSFQWEVRISSLSWRDIGVIKPNQDRIFFFDMKKRQFQIRTRPVENYTEMMNDKIELKLSEIPDWCKRLDNFTFTKRLKEAGGCLMDKCHPMRCRLGSFLYMLKIKRSFVESRYTEKVKEVEKHNEALKKIYKEDIERQQWYKEFAPGQIELILLKQAELKNYFEGLGYKENNDLTWN